MAIRQLCNICLSCATPDTIGCMPSQIGGLKGEGLYVTELSVTPCNNLIKRSRNMEKEKVSENIEKKGNR